MVEGEGWARLLLRRPHDARPRQIGGGDEQHDLGLLPHAEVMDRLGEAPLQHDLDVALGPRALWLLRPRAIGMR